jgi:GNAT superfamily N-acetyltransferase
MNATLTRPQTQKRQDVRVARVDNAHPQWRRVLSLIARTGDRRKLQIDSDGWLSARQVVLAAFLDGEPIAHLSFQIEPARRCIQARLDTLGIDPAHADRGIESRLFDDAVKWVRELRCTRLVGFDLGHPWR